MKQSLLKFWNSHTRVEKTLLLACGFLFLIGAFFRFYKLPSNMPFYGDQGMDLIAAWRIMEGKFFPLVGPLTNIPDFTTPPTYYYLLAGILAIFKSEVAAVFVFGVLNLASGFLFTLFVKDRFDKKTAYLFFCLYMISSCAVEQARMLWQPHAIAFFVSLGLWLFIKAEKTRSLNTWLCGVISTMIGMTVYAGGLLLLPFILFQGRKFWKNQRRGFFMNLTCMAVFLFLFHASSLLYEIQHAFPSWQAVFSISQEPGAVTHFALPTSLSGLRDRTIVHFSMLLFSLTPAPFLIGLGHLEIKYVLLTTFVVLGLIIFWRKKHSKRSLTRPSPFGFRYIFLSFVPLIFLETGPIHHRFLGYLPIILIAFALLLKKLSGKKGLPLILAVCFAGIFLFFNLSHFPRFIRNRMTGKQTYQNTQDVRHFVLEDMKARELTFADVDLHQITDEDIYDYDLQALWFLLYKDAQISVSPTPAGNDISRDVTVPIFQEYSYLICYMLYSPLEKCPETFLSRNTDFKEINRVQLGTHTVILFQRISDEQN